MNKNMLHLPNFKSTVLVGILTFLMAGTATGAIKDDESRELLERILEAHTQQLAALANYTFRAQWDTNTSGPGDYLGSSSGTIHRIHQGDRRFFRHNSRTEVSGTPHGDGINKMETVGALNEEYYATWAVDTITGKYISLKWYETPSDGTVPETASVFGSAITHIRPLELAMGHGGKPLKSLIDSYPEEKILFTCREETTAEGEQRIRVTIDRTAGKRPGTWASMLLNPAKGYMTEESVVFGENGLEFTTNVKLTEVRDGVWFPKEIVQDTTAPTANFQRRANHFQLLDFRIGETYPDEQFTISALNTPKRLLNSMGVTRHYLDGRIEVTTLDGRDHLKSKRQASLSRVEE